MVVEMLWTSSLALLFGITGGFMAGLSFMPKQPRGLVRMVSVVCVVMAILFLSMIPSRIQYQKTHSLDWAPKIILVDGKLYSCKAIEEVEATPEEWSGKGK